MTRPGGALPMDIKESLIEGRVGAPADSWLRVRATGNLQKKKGRNCSGVFESSPLLLVTAESLVRDEAAVLAIGQDYDCLKSKRKKELLRKYKPTNACRRI